MACGRASRSSYAGDNLVYTTDFRRVYASVIEGWLGYARTEELLRGRFEPFQLFG